MSAMLAAQAFVAASVLVLLAATVAGLWELVRLSRLTDARATARRVRALCDRDEDEWAEERPTVKVIDPRRLRAPTDPAVH